MTWLIALKVWIILNMVYVAIKTDRAARRMKR